VWRQKTDQLLCYLISHRDVCELSMSVKKKFASVTDIHVKTTTKLQCLRINATELLLGIISIYYDTYHYLFLQNYYWVLFVFTTTPTIICFYRTITGYYFYLLRHLPLSVSTELLLGIISIYYNTYHYTFLHILFTTILLSFIIYQNKNVNNNYMQFYY
jgi:hypothetical protein